MFGNRKDPMIDTVQKVMDENARRRQIEADLNEELGIQDRKQLGHEKYDLYDQALSQRINEAVLSPKQKQLAAIAGNPKKIDASDLAKLRGMKNEANEEPPFKPDPPRKKRPDEPKTARGLARKMMKKMKDKAAKDTQKTFPNVKHLTPAGNPDWHKHGYKDMPIKEEEQIDELSKKTLGSYIKKPTATMSEGNYTITVQGNGPSDAPPVHRRTISLDVIVPVELASFSATTDKNDVILTWFTATETNNSGFEVQRKTTGEYESVAFVDGKGTTTETQNYLFRDKNLLSNTYLILVLIVDK